MACQLSADEEHLRAMGVGNGDDAGKKIDGRCTATSARRSVVVECCEIGEDWAGGVVDLAAPISTMVGEPWWRHTCAPISMSQRAAALPGVWDASGQAQLDVKDGAKG